MGAILVKKLLADPAVHHIILVARSSAKIKSPKLSEVLFRDLDEVLSLSNKLAGDIYFCALGTTIKTAGSQEAFRKVDLEAVYNFGKVAKAHKAKSFVLVSAAGANSKSSIFYNRTKGEAEESLKSLHLDSLTFFRPAFLVGERKESRPLESIFSFAVTPLLNILPGKYRKYALTDTDVLASRMLEVGKFAVPGLTILEAPQI